MAIHLCIKRKRLKTARVILSLIFILLVSAGLNAQQNQPTAVPKHCLWEVESPSNTVFLLGSLHVLKSDAYPLAKEINNAYSASPKVVFETDIGGMMDPAVQAKMLSMGLYPEGESLLENISQKCDVISKKGWPIWGCRWNSLPASNPGFLQLL